MAHLLHGGDQMQFPYQVNQGVCGSFHQSASGLLPLLQGEEGALRASEIVSKMQKIVPSKFPDYLVSESRFNELSVKARGTVASSLNETLTNEANSKAQLVGLCSFGHRLDDLDQQDHQDMADSSIGSTTWNSEMPQNMEVTSPAPSSNSTFTSSLGGADSLNSPTSFTTPLLGSGLSSCQGCLPNEHQFNTNISVNSYGHTTQWPVDALGLNNPRLVSLTSTNHTASGFSSNLSIISPENYSGYENSHILHPTGLKGWSSISDISSYRIPSSLSSDGPAYGTNFVQDADGSAAREDSMSFHLHGNMLLKPGCVEYPFGNSNIPSSSINSWDNYGNMDSSVAMTHSRVPSHRFAQEAGSQLQLLQNSTQRTVCVEKNLQQCRMLKKQLQPPRQYPHQPYQEFDQHQIQQKEQDLYQLPIQLKHRKLGLIQPQRIMELPIQMKDKSMSEQMSSELLLERNISSQPQPSLKRSSGDQCSTSEGAAFSSVSEKSGEELQYHKERQFLLVYHHALTCPDQEGKCPRACIAMKDLVNHMSHCNDVQCAKSCYRCKKLVQHYRNCLNSACNLCIPVRTKLKNVFLQTSTAVTTKLKSKRMKTEVSSLSPCQTATSKILQTVADRNQFPSGQPQGLQHPDKEEEAFVNTRSGGMKVELNLSANSSQERSIKSCEVKFGGPEVVLKVQPGVVHVVKDEIVVQCETENIQVKKEVDEAETVIKCKTPASPAVQVSQTNLGKTKLKGVSLIGSFTADHVREHLSSLRQSVGQSKAKAEKHQEMEQVIDKYSCSLCGMENILFEPPPRYCASCPNQISPKGTYYCTEFIETKSDGNNVQRFICNKCYNNPGENIKVAGGEISKASLLRKWNYGETDAETESWVQCDRCEAWQHQICALFNGKMNEVEQVVYTCPSCFLHEVESGEQKALPHYMVPGANDLPTTMLSDHIEQWLFRRLKEERQERANNTGRNFDELPTAEGLVVRVVSSVNKKVEVRDVFQDVFKEENYPSEFPYVSKAILLFQNIEGADVCLFAMYVQEFGSECASPNQRHVCISYIDSVKYFRPEIEGVTGEALRTFAYHEILIGYLDYCKKQGFVTCYIWACPPLKRDDYILYCHPEIQKIPNYSKLREWYQTIIRKAAKEKIVVDSTNLFDQFFVPTKECKAKITASRLPYFDSDFWPGEAEKLLQNDGSMLHRKGTKAAIERTLRAARRDSSVGNPKDILLMHQLGEIIRPIKESFIMIHLQHVCKHCCQPILSGNLFVCNVCKNFQLCEKCHEVEKNLDNKDRHPIHLKEKHLFCMAKVEQVPIDTSDQDETILSEVFDTRLVFLNLCQGNKYQFDTLRRAKYSTMMILYHLHNPTPLAFMSSCSGCHNDIESGIGWHCWTCPDYDLCESCYQRRGSTPHDHELVSRASVADSDVIQNKMHQQRQTLKLILEALVHASSCSARPCPQPFCLKVKGLFRHGSKCQTRVHGGCKPCKFMWHILQAHARACKQSKCLVPRCRDLKDHLRKMQLQSDSRRRAGAKGRIRQQEEDVSGDSN